MSKYYSLKKIKKYDATYNVIFGERSNGKTHASLEMTLQNYFKDGSQFAYVRRWKEDITGRRASMLFAGINELNIVSELSDGEFQGVHYYAGKLYLCTYDDHGKAIYNDGNVIGYLFAVSSGEHNKSTSYPKVTTIIFDEFLTSSTYLPDEFVLFMNVVSTIVRRRTNVKIFMLGNTVNRFSPYFTEMGLNNIAQMEQGTIDLYSYGESELKVAVEYCATTNDTKSKKENKYFAFDNPKLDMITGGAWEMSIYPHLPVKYKPKNVLMNYYIEFNDKIYDCEIIEIDGISFTYIHNKTTPIKDPDNHYIYSLEHNPKMNYNRSIFKPINTIQERILWYFRCDRVYYQDNEVGDSISNYLKVARGIR